jgi:ATP-binding cassette subfamily C (CFTR/MRP) protein 1
MAVVVYLIAMMAAQTAQVVGNFWLKRWTMAIK